MFRKKLNHLLKTRASTNAAQSSSCHTSLLPSFYFLSFSSQVKFSFETPMFSSRLLIFSKSSFFAILCHLPVFQKKKISVDLLHLPDDLLLEDRQDGVVVTHLLEHDPAVKLVAHFLEVEPVHTHTHNTHGYLIISQSKDVKMTLKMHIPTLAICFKTQASDVLTCNGPFW